MKKTENKLFFVIRKGQKVKVLSILFLLFSFFVLPVNSQIYVVKNIKAFGAKGDGKTNDNAAFQKAAAYFNKRGGNGKLIIPKGAYIIGKQEFTGGQPNKPAYTGSSTFSVSNIKNFTIQGSAGATLKYVNGLRIGAFSPETGKPYDHGNNLFVNSTYAAIPGYCLYFENCKNILVSNLNLNGNSDNLILGGVYGDVGIQIPHYGIFVRNSQNVTIDKINAHHFGLDGMCVSNIQNEAPDSITIINSVFEYNSRQGLSWVGGNSLYVKNCKFNHTGKGKFSSPPAAGVDIEAEAGPIRNGVFEKCEFVNNTGCGMVADSGDGGYCTFNNCTFWGTTMWSLWVNKPGFTFNTCNIYGSMVHGYDAPDIKSATKFFTCHFEDKLYNGMPPYGNYLVESNYKKRMSFEACTFISNSKKICWLDSPGNLSTEEKYQLNNCSFIIQNNNLPYNDFVGIMRGTARKNCTFTFTDPDAAKKRYYIGGFGEASNIDLGKNKVIVK